MDVASAHKKLLTATAQAQDKLRDLAAFADEFAGDTHRVAPRVEVDRYTELCSDLDYALEAHTQARAAFLRTMRGDE